MPHTTARYSLLSLQREPVLDVADDQHVGHEPRHVVDDPDRGAEQRDRADDPEQRAEPRADGRLQRVALGLDEVEVFDDHRIVVANASALPVRRRRVPDAQPGRAGAPDLAASDTSPHGTHGRGAVGQHTKRLVRRHRYALPHLRGVKSLEDGWCTADVIRIAVCGHDRHQAADTQCPHRRSDHPSADIEAAAGRSATRIHQHRRTVGQAQERGVALCHVQERHPQPGATGRRTIQELRLAAGGTAKRRATRQFVESRGPAGDDDEQAERPQRRADPTCGVARQGPGAPPGDHHQHHQPQRRRRDMRRRPRHQVDGARAVSDAARRKGRDQAGRRGQDRVQAAKGDDRKARHLHHAHQRHRKEVQDQAGARHLPKDQRGQRRQGDLCDERRRQQQAGQAHDRGYRT